MTDETDRPSDDPRLRPPDPAGTRPKVDPASLLAAPRERRWLEPVAGAHERPLPLEVEAAPPGPVERPHAERFSFLRGALIACALVAVGAAVALVLAGGGGPAQTSGPQWSAWRPTVAGTEAAAQIAQYVGSSYKSSAGEQLMVVTGGPLSVSGAGMSGGNLPLSIVVQRPPAQGGSASLVEGKGVLYRLCGLGKDCAIAGKPSTERWLLVRREALELALYTFRYVDGVQNVVVFTPPPRRPDGRILVGKGAPASRALFFRRADVEAQLRRPLSSTLTRTVPRPEAAARAPDAGFVDLLTAPRVFSFRLQPSNSDNSGFLVLQQG